MRPLCCPALSTARSLGTRAPPDPGNGQVLGSLPEMTVDDTRQAIQHAKEALKSWRKTTEYERAAILQKIFQCASLPLEQWGGGGD